MRHSASLLACGRRLHLQHGPIDLIIGAEGKGSATEMAFEAAEVRFATLLTELVAELPDLRAEMTQSVPFPTGRVAQRMDRAVRPLSSQYVTRMAAVAGSVADEVLESMTAVTSLDRAYVNNGGDIAVHLDKNETYLTAMKLHDGTDIGRISLTADMNVKGIATSGRHGRSFSMGIADSVTILARSAAVADVAATLIANAVDLPGHSCVRREPANALDPESDLGVQKVVTGCASLCAADIDVALEAGLNSASSMKRNGIITAAVLCLQGQVRVLGELQHPPQRSLAHA